MVSVNTYPICESSLKRSPRRSFVPSQNRAATTVLMCEQKPYPVHGFRGGAKAIRYRLNMPKPCRRIVSPSFRDLFTHYYLGAWNKLWDLSQFLRFRCLAIACAGWWVELDPIIHLGATSCYVGDNTVSGCWNKHLLGSVQEMVEEGVQWPGVGALPIVAYTGRLHQKGVPYEASYIGKGRNFTTDEPLHNGQLAPCKEIQDSLGFWIPRRGFRILGTGFQIFFNGTWILNSNC